MDNCDRDNLKFLLSANEETLRDWYSKASNTDHEYAKLLLEEYNKELSYKLSMLRDDVEDISDAGRVVRKYML